MKPIIRKKDKDSKGSQRYILQWISKGKIKTFGFTASKLLDSLKKSKIIKEESL